jgi:transmembrane sensor
MDDETLEIEIARFVAGKSSAEEAARVREWIGGDPERQQYVDGLTQTWELGQLPFSRWDAERAWRDLAAGRAARPRAIPGSRLPAPASLRWSLGWPLRAAAVLVLAVGGALLWRSLPKTAAPAPIVQTHEYATRPGQRAELRLADGTRVLLNVDSRIRVPTEFGSAKGSAERSVSLEGEAFFDVRHDPDHPFRVRTARGIAEDLGTEFVVSAYPESRGMQVAVVSGAVALRRDTSARSAAPLRLTRGDLALLDSTRAEVRRDIDLAPYVGWTTGSLVFEGAPLGIALPRIERWYDVEIRLADSALADRRLTATFHDTPLEHVLELLALSFSLRVDRRGRSITLTPKSGVSTH